MTRSIIREHLTKLQSVVALVVMTAALSFATDNFLTVDNGINVFRQISVNVCLSIGMTMIIVAGGIDLSVGSVLALSGAVAAGLLKNGVVLATTLGAEFGFLGTGTALGVPMPVWIAATLTALFELVTRRTRFGRHLYAVGGNERAAVLSGLSINRIKLAVYALGGALAGIAGLLTAARLDSATPNAGFGYELDSIAAVVIGGTSLSGGRGSIIGTVLGCLIIGVLNNGLVLLQVSPFWQQVVKGFVILAAVAIDRASRSED
jgi:ribose transport system permease protein